jgi:hypothetical protein
MAKSKQQIDELRERVRIVRDKFRANPETKWLPTFRNEHPQFADHSIRNVYYLQSTDAAITSALEKHWNKYSKFKDQK